MNLSNGRIWPYAIGTSILIIFGACVATIIVATKLPVEKSDTYMMKYQDADASANELIEAQIAFNKKYKIEYINSGLSLKNTALKYRVTDLENSPVDNAEIKVIITRPNNHKNDQELTVSTYEDGIYSFENITLPIEGRWDIMAKLTVGENERFYNIKADTRELKVTEY